MQSVNEQVHAENENQKLIDQLEEENIHLRSVLGI